MTAGIALPGDGCAADIGRKPDTTADQRFDDAFQEEEEGESRAA